MGCAGLIGGAADNPFTPFFRTPSPEIYHLVQITKSENGNVSSVVGFGIPFPALDYWQYGGSNGPELVLCVSAAGKTPLDLIGTTAYSSSCH